MMVFFYGSNIGQTFCYFYTFVFMALYKESTKTNPLLFFETFINDKVILKHEDMFYYPINPSQENYRDQGYLTFYKDSYEEEENPIPEKIFFKDYLEKLLKSQMFLSNQFLIERRDELEYQNIIADIFIKKQLIIINQLKVKINSITIYKEVFIKALDILEKNINEIDLVEQESTKKKLIVKTNNPFFEPKVNRAVLIKLYDIAVDHKIIDDEEVLEETFINVFMSNDPESLQEKIFFKVNNQYAAFFLICIKPLFEKLSFPQISRSQSFHNKNGKLLNENDLGKAKNLFEKKPKNTLCLSLENEIAIFIPKKK